jgi:predicted dienelactone hydrolase
LTFELWYPAPPGGKATIPDSLYVQSARVEDASPVPGRRSLILLSHGLTSRPESLAWLADRLVRCGFAVAAPQHLDPTFKTPHMDHWQRAEDLRFVLTYLLQSDDGRRSIDSRKVGMAGFSLGGGTGIWLAGGRASAYRRTANPGPRWAPPDEFPPVDSPIYRRLMETTDFKAAAADHSDPRIRAFYLMAPSLGWAFEPQDLARIHRPLRIVVGKNDEMLVPETNALHYARSIAGSELMVLPPPTGHFVFHAALRPGQESRFDPDGTLRAIYTDPPGVDRRDVQHTVAADCCAFFQRWLLSPSP